MGTKPIIEGATRKDGWAVAPEILRIPGLDTKDGPEHPLYQEKRLRLPILESLVQSTMAIGFVRSVLVFKPEGADYLEVIDGIQGVRAAREANRRFKRAGSDKRVVCEILSKKGTPAELAAMTMTLNYHRQQDDMATQSEAVHHALYEIKPPMTIAQIATAMGISDVAVRSLAKLDKMAPEVKDAIRDGRVKATNVLEQGVAKLTHAQQADVVKATPGAASVRKTQQFLSDLESDEQKADAAEIVERALGKAPTRAEQRAKTKPATKPAGKIGAKEIAKRVAAVKGEEAHVLPGKKEWRALIEFCGNNGAPDLAGGGARRNGFILALQLITGALKISDVPGAKKALKNVGFEA